MPTEAKQEHTELSATLPDDEKNDDSDEYMSEEEEEALEEREERSIRRTALGLVVFSVFGLIAAAILYLLEKTGGICVGYPLPLYTLPLVCMAACFLGMMMALFIVRKNSFAMLIMVFAGWMILGIYGLTNFQEPEQITKLIPGTEKQVIFTMTTTPFSSIFTIDDPIKEYVISHRWRIPVPSRSKTLDELITMEQQDNDEVWFYYEDRLWAIYEPDKDNWYNIFDYDDKDGKVAKLFETTTNTTRATTTTTAYNWDRNVYTATSGSTNMTTSDSTYTSMPSNKKRTTTSRTTTTTATTATTKANNNHYKIWN